MRNRLFSSGSASILDGRDLTGSSFGLFQRNLFRSFLPGWSSPRQGRPMYRSLSIPKGPIGPSDGGCDLINVHVKEMCGSGRKGCSQCNACLGGTGPTGPRSLFDIRYGHCLEKGVTLVEKMTSLQKLPRHRKSLMFGAGIRLPSVLLCGHF